ncbi:MAG: polysaccharide biosynthesis tyrosine autokinase [Actinomycetota bacterium]|nr:polysaccharide biosynthesis tyrosine autokinase [Actinomycetota bacterium]
MELSQYLQAIRSHWRLILCMTLIGIAAAGAVTVLIPPSYASTSKLFVSTSGTETNSAQANIVAQDRVPSYAQLLGTEQFAKEIIAQLGLTDMLPSDLANNVEAVVAPNSVILEITVTDASPERAQLITNTMATKFVELVTQLETPDPVTTIDANGVTVITPQVAPVKVTVAQAGGLPFEPVFPDPMLNLPLGALVGLLLGLMLALLRYLMDNTVKSVKQVEELTGSTTIGGVLYDPEMEAEPLVTQHKAQSITSEAYRQIRTNLQYVSVDNPPKVIVVTSSVSGEGKTTTAINLALVLAQSGQRVALIEADLRRPRVIRYLQLVGGAGLTNILAGKAHLSELLQPWGDGKLSVLASGPNPPDPSELLGSEQMKHLLEDLRESHDYVIIDAPPLLPVTDAAVLAILADGVVIVTRWGATKREQLRAAAAMVRVIDVRVLGTVLNMIPPKGGSTYGYGYGYGYSYEPDPSPREMLRSAPGGRSRGRTTADVGAPGTVAAFEQHVGSGVGPPQGPRR